MATKRPRSGKTVRAPRARKTKTQSVKVEELQTVGADIIPAETIEVTVQAPPTTLFSDWDLHLFNEGTHLRLWEKLGAHIMAGGGMFAVWAPNADRVSVIGDFNGGSHDAHPLQARAQSGIWEGFIPAIGKGTVYKYHIISRHNGYIVDKSDPVGFMQELSPKTASIVWDLGYEWNDAEWLQGRKERNSYHAPMSIYEMHIGSWRRTGDNQPLSYRDLAQPL